MTYTPTTALLLTLAFGPSTVIAYDVTIGRPTVSKVGEKYNVAYPYTITGGPDPIQEGKACITNECKFFPIPRTGLGPSGKPGDPLGDQGGVSNVQNMYKGVKLFGQKSWNDAFAEFLKAYPASGDFVIGGFITERNLKWVNWDALCIGFATLDPGRNISNLAPGTACERVPRPGNACNVQFPGLVDLGIVTAGTAGASGSAVGEVACSQPSSIAGSLLNDPRIDGTDVEIDINGHVMGRSAVIVGVGMYVPLVVKATIRGTLRNAGTYSSDAILQISYD